MTDEQLRIRGYLQAQGAKLALSDLWFAWVKQGGSSSVKPDVSFAKGFFLKQGATAQQADVPLPAGLQGCQVAVAQEGVFRIEMSQEASRDLRGVERPGGELGQGGCQG